MITEIIVACGLVGIMGLLYKTNHDYCTKNEKNIDKNREDFHNLDKKIDVLIATLEITYPQAFKEANNKVNGED